MRPYTCRFILLISILLLGYAKTDAQYSRLVVTFTDKNNSPYSLTHPLEFLSRKSVERRKRFSIPLDSTDLPVNPRYIKQVVKQGPVTYLSQSKWLNQILIDCSDAATISAIRGLPFVKGVFEVGPAPQLAAPTRIDKFRGEQPATLNTQGSQASPSTNSFNYGNSFNQVHIHNGDFLHDKGYSGDGMTIAIIDAGFYQYRSIKAFDSARALHHFLGEKDFVDYDNNVNENDSHGEYCLSTIAANVPGVMVGTAPHASFWLLRSENTASEYPIEEHNWVVAAEFADSAGADMISSSLGYSQFDDPSFNHSYADFYQNSTMVSKGATYAARKGMIVTNSAGNEGGTSWKYLLFPADDDSLCSVGAINTAGQIAYFSSYGYPGRLKPNVVSVGDNTVVYTSFGVSTASGTSFSNPNVNGLIACLWEAFPSFNNMQILQAVYASSDRFTGPDNRYGDGIPDMRKAYRILKYQQNLRLFGKEWLFATRDPVTRRIQVTLVGRTDGKATLTLSNADGRVLSTNNLQTEKEEIYHPSFHDNGTSGKLIIGYNDASTSRTIELDAQKLPESWFTASPVPFGNKLTVRLKAPETGMICIRLLTAGGSEIRRKLIQVTKDNAYDIEFDNLFSLSSGLYFVAYQGKNVNKSIAVEK